jgi:putative peptide zinc metalloprotease protein
LLIAGIIVPLPHRVTVPAVLQPKGSRRVFVAVGGTLISAIKPGTVVHKGDTLGKLENSDLERDIIQLQGRVEGLSTQLESLKRRSAHATHLGTRDPGSEIPATQQALADIEQRRQNRLHEQQRLTLTAPIDGSVLPPPHRPSVSGDDELENWSGSPLDESNIGAYLETGTLFCRVGDPDQFEAVLIVNQSEIEFVRVGQTVRLQLDQLPGRYLGGVIVEISEIDVETAPPELISGGDLPIRPDVRGKPQLVGVFYQANVAVDDQTYKLTPGAVGRARIYAAPMSLGRRIVRYLSSTLRLQL